MIFTYLFLLFNMTIRKHKISYGLTFVACIIFLLDILKTLFCLDMLWNGPILQLIIVTGFCMPNEMKNCSIHFYFLLGWICDLVINHTNILKHMLYYLLSRTAVNVIMISFPIEEVIWKIFQ